MAHTLKVAAVQRDDDGNPVTGLGGKQYSATKARDMRHVRQVGTGVGVQHGQFIGPDDEDDEDLSVYSDNGRGDGALDLMDVNATFNRMFAVSAAEDAANLEMMSGQIPWNEVCAERAAEDARIKANAMEDVEANSRRPKDDGIYAACGTYIGPGMIDYNS